MMYFFDLDGTLLDSNGIWLDIDVAFLGRFGIDPVPREYTDYVAHHSYPDAAAYTRERFGLSQSPEEIMAAWGDMAREAYAHRLPLKPGARALLDRLSRRGERMAVVTSCMPDLCRAALERHGLLPRFEEVFTTAELGVEKREAALYRLVARRCGLEPSACVLFEDSPGYCAAARQAGWQPWAVRDPLFAGREEELRAICGPDRLLDRLDQFPF